MWELTSDVVYGVANIVLLLVALGVAAALCIGVVFGVMYINDRADRAILKPFKKKGDA